MDEIKYREDLREIKDMMSRSSRFLSLSGLSGVSAGFVALIGAYFAYTIVYMDGAYSGYGVVEYSRENITSLLIIAVLTIFFALLSGIWFTTRKAKKKNEKIWDLQAKRLLINLGIPLVAGGILCLILFAKGYGIIVAPLTLIFYGLALVNASRYTLPDIRSLGFIEIILGLFATYFAGFGLLFWVIGFGLLHIIYGIVMHYKYPS